MQEVYKSYTVSGKPGYFTTGYLAWSLTQEQYDKPDSWHSEYARSLNFKYVQPPNCTRI